MAKVPFCFNLEVTFPKNSTVHNSGHFGGEKGSKKMASAGKKEGEWKEKKEKELRRRRIFKIKGVLEEGIKGGIKTKQTKQNKTNKTKKNQNT